MKVGATHDRGNLEVEERVETYTTLAYGFVNLKSAKTASSLKLGKYSGGST